MTLNEAVIRNLPGRMISPGGWDIYRKVIIYTFLKGSLMNLSFLGRTYKASNPSIEATETQETATFLGRRYARKQFHVTRRQPIGEELSFMGQRYSR
jgi:hypothetical protein